MYKLSIIIPVYNLEEYLKRCLNSVMLQDTSEVEIIIVNDGSSDGTEKICNEYVEKYSNIKAYYKKNEGLSIARNFGISKASGEYVLFLDGDDFLSRDALKNILNEINQGNSDVIIGKCILYYPMREKYVPCDYHLDRKIINGLVKEELLKELLDGKTYEWYACLNIVRKKYLVKNKLYFKEKACFEDAMWTPELLFLAESVSCVDEPFYIYLQNREGSITASLSKKVYEDKLNVCLYAEEFCEKYQLSAQFSQKFLGNYNNIYVSLLADSWRFGKNQRKNYWRKLRQYKKILWYSGRTYQRCLYKAWKMIGIRGVSYILHMRAEWVRNMLRCRR